MSKLVDNDSKKRRSVMLRLTPKLEEIVNFLQDIEGHPTFTATIYSAISFAYTKKYVSKTAGATIDPIAKAKQRSEIDGMTDEQICELMAGEIKVTEYGVRVCKVVERNHKGVRGKSFKIGDAKDYYEIWKETGSIWGSEPTK